MNASSLRRKLWLGLRAELSEEPAIQFDGNPQSAASSGGDIPHFGQNAGAWIIVPLPPLAVCCEHEHVAAGHEQSTLYFVEPHDQSAFVAHEPSEPTEPVDMIGVHDGGGEMTSIAGCESFTLDASLVCASLEGVLPSAGFPASSSVSSFPPQAVAAAKRRPKTMTRIHVR